MHLFSDKSFSAVDWINPYANLRIWNLKATKLIILRTKVKFKSLIVDFNLSLIVNSFFPNDPQFRKEFIEPFNNHCLDLIVSLYKIVSVLK
jgi:hypothetical protein